MERLIFSAIHESIDSKNNLKVFNANSSATALLNQPLRTIASEAKINKKISSYTISAFMGYQGTKKWNSD